MVYAAPGNADDLDDEILERWNEVILGQYARLEPDYGSRFFALEPPMPPPQRHGVSWFGNPAEPEFCLGGQVARDLSDWGVRGRHALHNEYCEYATVTVTDEDGRLRPKRVQVTTELSEYWITLATYAPKTMRSLVADMLGAEPRWPELFGPRVSDPDALTPRQRRIRFARQMAGHGNSQDLIDAGVPANPTGSLNTNNALFMTHGINGLDDLLYIVMFGAQPYAHTAGGQLEPAGRDEIFRHSNTTYLACRHADPAAAMAAAGAAFAGRTVAFADPLGMYIQQFTAEVFSINGAAVPAEWIRFSRGRDGLHQRLEFGPDDDDPEFLDDIVISEGASDEPVRGGYQVVRQVEVGPFLNVGDPTPVADDEYIRVAPSHEPIRCQDADVCESVRALKAQYDEAMQAGVVLPRPTGLRR